MQAEFDNYRKRTQKQISDTLEQGQKKLSSELLVILENLDKALEFKEIDFNGLELIDREFNNILAAKGLKRMDALNKQFDHNLHHAVGFSEVDSNSDYTDGIIIEVLQKGFYWKDEVLRPAMVIVAKEKEVSESKDNSDSEIKSEESPQTEDIEENK